jgi:hypothetical protein
MGVDRAGLRTAGQELFDMGRDAGMQAGRGDLEGALLALDGGARDRLPPRAACVASTSRLSSSLTWFFGSNARGASVERASRR